MNSEEKNWVRTFNRNVDNFLILILTMSDEFEGTSVMYDDLDN